MAEPVKHLNLGSAAVLVGPTRRGPAYASGRSLAVSEASLAVSEAWLAATEASLSVSEAWLAASEPPRRLPGPQLHAPEMAGLSL